MLRIMTYDQFAPFGAAILLLLLATFCLLIKGHLREGYLRKLEKAKNRIFIEQWMYEMRIIEPAMRCFATLFYIMSLYAIVYGILQIRHSSGLKYLSNILQ